MSITYVSLQKQTVMNITINGYIFAANKTELINRLAKPNGTGYGTYKKLKNHVKLYNGQNEYIGMINRFGVVCLFPVFENRKELGEHYQLKTSELMTFATFTGYSKGDSLYKFN